MLPTGRKNANHDGVTQQICDRLRDFETENQLLIQSVNEVHQARQAEDTAFKRFSGKDFASDDLKREDALEDKYMSTALGILNDLLVLLFAIEDRAKLYYISGGSTGGGTTPPGGGGEYGDME